MSFLPISKKEMLTRGWDSCDFILINGDAYVDHPSFGGAVISRVLEDAGFKVGIISQPRWDNCEDFKLLGCPRLGFLVTAGNMDSMVNRYTVNRRLRSTDAYSPGGKAGMRPDRATIMYTSKIKQAYKGIPVIIGGVEASLRRLSHYDYWSDKLRRSILLDSKADILIYGMGERSIVEIAHQLEKGHSIKDIAVPGTVVRRKTLEGLGTVEKLPSFEELTRNKQEFAKSFAIRSQYNNPHLTTSIAEKTGDFYLVQLPPSLPLTRKELDRVYELPFERQYHPSYQKDGGIPALKEVKFSLVSSRGCFGNCSFCAIAFHQGRTVFSRSEESLIKETKILMKDPDFKGYIHDVGGPTANFRFPACKKQEIAGPCNGKNCLDSCPNLVADHKDYIHLLRSLRSIPGIKKVFIRSGIRYDYLLLDKHTNFLEELCRYHISGQLKIAPEHISNKILNLMGKPKKDVYEDFCDQFAKMNTRIGKKQYIIPYFISSHPGSTLKEAIELAEYLRDTGFIPDQVQDFYPTPGTRSTAMYYTGLDPLTMKKVYIPSGAREKSMQRALLQYNRMENYALVKEALIQANRQDLIGEGSFCLIRNRSDIKTNKRGNNLSRRNTGKNASWNHKKTPSKKKTNF